MRWPLTLASVLAPGLSAANPAGGQVVAGQATINAPNAGTLVINQSSHSAAINWQQFSVGSNEYVVFNQPSASSTVLNRVVGGMPSEILGNISANGRVFLVNPNGIAFGKGAQVDVGGLVASTMDIGNDDFLKGRYVFAGAPGGGGKVSNAGVITARDGGFVVLAGTEVSNSGLIQARLGDVALGSGSAMTLDIGGDGLVNFVVDRAAVSDAAGIENLGEITANGGVVVMAANVARSLIGNAVNNAGRVSAQSIEEHDGAIYLTATGGHIAQTGTLDASGNDGADGGFVAVRGDRDILLGEQAQILARGADGGEVRLIAGQRLDTAEGSLVDVRGSAGGNGGFVELSGHQSFSARGEVRIGQGGSLLIDPNDIKIVANGQSQCVGADSCFGTDSIESFLDDGVNVYVIAANSITLESFGADNSLNSTGSGNLLFGIGSPASGSLPNHSDGYGGTNFVQGSVTATDGGFIRALSDDLKIDIGGYLEITGASNRGDVRVGNLKAAGIEINAADSIQTGSLTATTDDVDLYAGRSISIGGSVRAENDDILLIAEGGAVHVAGDVSALSDSVEIYAAGDAEQFYGIQIEGDVFGRGLIDLTAGSGGINVGNVSLEHRQFDGGDGSLFMQAAGNILVEGLISAISDYGGVDIGLLSSGGSIELRGAQTEGGLTSLIAESRYNDDQPSPGFSQAVVTLTANQGIDVRGGVSISADAVPTSYTIPEFDGQGEQIGEIEVSLNESTALFSAQTCATGSCTDDGDFATATELPTAGGLSPSDGNISFEGRVHIEAEGSATVLVGTDGNISFGDKLSVDAGISRSQYIRRDFSSDSSEAFEVQDGQATVFMIAGGEVTPNEENEGITTHGIDVTAANASVFLNGGQLRLNRLGNDPALKVTAITDDPATQGVVEGAYFAHRVGDQAADLTSNFGSAEVSLVATNAANAPAVGIDGDVSVSGPAASMTIASAGDVLLQNGDLEITGTGYRINGDWSHFDAAFDSGQGFLPDFSRFSAETDDAVPHASLSRLDQGELRAGGAELFISGYSTGIETESTAADSPPIAGNVQILGDILVEGAGSADVAIFATGLDVDGDIGVEARLGYIQGSARATIDQGEGIITSYDYAFSDGNEGAAQYSIANFEFSGAGSASQVSLANLTLVGGGAAAVIDNVGRFEADNVRVLGGTGGNTPVYVESLRVTRPDGSSDSYVTEITGEISVFDIGFPDFEGEVIPDVVTISGDLEVVGTGMAAAVVRGGSVDIGNVEVDARLGRYSSDNPDYAADLGKFGDALAWIEATGANPASIAGNLSVLADGDVHLGLRAAVGGDAVIRAGRLGQGHIDQTLSANLLGFEHPAASFSGVELAPEELITVASLDVESDLLLANTNLTARNITLDFDGTGGALDNSVLRATENLTVMGGGSLDAGTGLDWSANAVTLNNIDVSASGQIKLTAGDDVRLEGGSSLTGGTVLLDAGDLALSSGNVVIDAGGLSVRARQISMQSTDFFAGTTAVALGSDAALLSELPEALRPLSSGPNAAFEAVDGVAIGDLVMTGDYLFVRTGNFNPGSVSRGLSTFDTSGGALFMNVRRFNANETLDISAITLDSRFSSLQTTFVYGGSGYSGDLVTQSAIDLSPSNSNMVLKTTGRIIGQDLISPNGSVLVLEGSEPPPPPPPPPPPEDSVEEARDVQNGLAGLGQLADGLVENPQAIELAGADLVDETSEGEDEALECK